MFVVLGLFSKSSGCQKWQQHFFMNNLTVEEVFEAYYECRKTKRYSYGALSFEANYEENLVELFTELKNQTWKPGKSTCFIVNQPVK